MLVSIVIMSAFAFFVTRLRFIVHACFAFVSLVSLCVLGRLLFRVIVYALAFCTLQGCVSIYACVYIAGVVCVRALGLFVCVCMLVLRVAVYAFACVFCKVMFHTTHVYIAYAF